MFESFILQLSMPSGRRLQLVAAFELDSNQSVSKRQIEEYAEALGATLVDAQPMLGRIY